MSGFLSGLGRNCETWRIVILIEALDIEAIQKNKDKSDIGLKQA